MDNNELHKFLNGLDDSDKLAIHAIGYKQTEETGAYEYDNIYIYNFKHNLKDTKFFRSGLSDSMGNGYTAKVYTSLFNAKDSFQEELDGVSRLMSSCDPKSPPIQFPKYNKDDLFGMHVIRNSILKKDIWISFSEKCEETLEDIIKSKSRRIDIQTFLNVIEGVLNTIENLQGPGRKLHLAHGDLKPANIVRCGDKWKLVNWNKSRYMYTQLLKKKKKIAPN